MKNCRGSILVIVSVLFALMGIILNSLHQSARIHFSIAQLPAADAQSEAALESAVRLVVQTINIKNRILNKWYIIDEMLQYKVDYADLNCDIEKIISHDCNKIIILTVKFQDHFKSKVFKIL